MVKYETYKTSTGTKLHRWTAHLGIDKYTGKSVNTTHSKFKSEKLATRDYIKTQSYFDEHGSLKQKTYDTFSDVFEDWWDYYCETVQGSTSYKAGQLFKNHILPYYGDYRIDAITPAIVQKFVALKNKELVEYRKVINYSGKVFDYAVHLQLIADNPNKFIMWPRNKKENDKKVPDNFFERDQLFKFYDALDQLAKDDVNYNKSHNDLHYRGIKARAMLRLLVSLGMRKGEALGADWSFFNADEQSFYIGAALKRNKDGLYIGEPKSANAYRSLPLDKKTATCMIEWQKMQKKLFFKTGLHYTGKKQLIFTNESGGFCIPKEPRDYMLKIEKMTGLRHITVHGLRHTKGTLLAEAGANEMMIAAQLGHATGEFSLRHYVHTTNGELESSRQIWDDFMTK
jgi:integrase